MKEEEKYYTPSIEEFHEGFEYEVKNEYRNEWNKDIWDVISNYGDTKLYNLDVEKCRVKYLDKEDIESCGFKVDSIYSFKKGDYNIEVDPHNIQKDTIDIYLISDCIFKGKIKNKSELQRLMKQLGI